MATHHLIEIQADRRDTAIPVLISQSSYDKIIRLSRKWCRTPSQEVEKLVIKALKEIEE
jgi:hypothetical protein